jgi:L-aminoadipate-semialdehyde dehydrogenase
LPTSTKAPELDDSNTAALLQPHMKDVNMTVSDHLTGMYIAWLVGAGFLPKPSDHAPMKVLPSLGNDRAIRATGRSGI